MAPSSEYAMVSWLAILVLLVLFGMLVGGVVLVGALLANPKTRGRAMIGLAVAGVVFIFAAVLYLHEARMDRGRLEARLHAEQAAIQEAMEHSIGFDEVNEAPDAGAESMARFIADESEAMAKESNRRVVYSSNRTLMLAPVGLIALLVFAGVVIVAFKHGGVGIGLAALCLPVVLMFVSYQSVRQPQQATMIDSSRNYSEPRYVGEPVDVPYAIDVTDSDDGEREDTPKETAVEDSEEPSEGAAPAPTPAAEPSEPAWITSPPKRIGNVYRRVLQAGPYDTVGECQRAIGNEIESAVQEYIGEQVNAAVRGNTYHLTPARLEISPKYIRENLVREPYYKTVVTSVSDDMKTLYVLLEIDAKAHDRLMDHWRNHERQERIAVVGVGAGGLLAALAGVLGLLKLDTRTKGAYTKRLFIGVPLAIIGFIFLFS